LSLPPLEFGIQREIFLPNKRLLAKPLLFTDEEMILLPTSSTPSASMSSPVQVSNLEVVENAPLTKKCNRKSRKFFSMASLSEFTNTFVTSMTDRVGSRYVWPVTRVIDAALDAFRGVESDIFFVQVQPNRFTNSVVIEGFSVEASRRLLMTIQDVFYIRKILDVCRDTYVNVSSDNTQTALGAALDEVLTIIEISICRDHFCKDICLFQYITANHRSVLLQLLWMLLPKGVIQGLEHEFEASSPASLPRFIDLNEFQILSKAKFWLEYSRSSWDLLAHLFLILEEKLSFITEAELKILIDSSSGASSQTRFLKGYMSIQLVFFCSSKSFNPFISRYARYIVPFS
jgi:hypothetical protein